MNKTGNRDIPKLIAKYVVFICAFLTICMSSIGVNAANNKKPVISIHGQSYYEIEKGETIKLPKVTAKDKKDGDITKKIKIKLKSSSLTSKQCKKIAKRIRKRKKIVLDKTGDYYVEYSVKNRAGKKSRKKIHISVNEPKNKDWIMIQHNDDSGSQGMFYTFYNEYEDCLIVIDGGNLGNAEHVRSVIKSYGGGVDAWILTHYHPDHVDAFNVIMSDLQDIKVDKIYASPMNYEEYLQVAKYWDVPGSFTKFLEVTKGMTVSYLNVGDELMISNLNVKVFNSYEPNLSEIGDIPNNASLMFKITGKEESILFCGDCHTHSLGDKLVEKWGYELKADYVQTGHHGNNSLSTSFYDVVSPKVAFFDAPEWLMKGEQYTAKDLKPYFLNKGVIVYDMTTAPNEFVFK